MQNIAGGNSWETAYKRAFPAENIIPQNYDSPSSIQVKDVGDGEIPWLGICGLVLMGVIVYAVWKKQHENNINHLKKTI